MNQKPIERIVIRRRDDGRLEEWPQREEIPVDRALVEYRLKGDEQQREPTKPERRWWEVWKR